MREHRGPERRRIARHRHFRAAFQPGEQFLIGWRKAGPQNLNLVRLLVAERGGGGLGQPRRHADAQSAGHELEQRPAPGLVERIKPARQLRGKLRFAERRESFDHLGQRWDGVRALRRIGRPHQRDGFGQVADIVVGEFEQHRIGALGDQRADDARLGVLERQRAGQRRERKSALGVRRAAQIIRDQPQLVVAAGLIGEAVEQFGELVHG